MGDRESGCFDKRNNLFCRLNRRLFLFFVDSSNTRTQPSTCCREQTMKNECSCWAPQVSSCKHNSSLPINHTPEHYSYHITAITPARWNKECAFIGKRDRHKLVWKQTTSEQKLLRATRTHTSSSSSSAFSLLGLLLIWIARVTTWALV